MQLNIPATDAQQKQAALKVITEKLDAKLKLTPAELQTLAQTGDVRKILETLLLYVFK